MFHFFKAIFDTSFRLSQPFFGKWNWFVQMVNAIPGQHLPVLILRTICPNRVPPVCPCKCSLRATSPLTFIWWVKPTARERARELANERQSLPHSRLAWLLAWLLATPLNGEEPARRLMLIETFRFEDENDYEYEIWFKFFFAYFQKIDTPEFSILLFSTRKVSTVIVIYWRSLSPLPSNIW